MKSMMWPFSWKPLKNRSQTSRDQQKAGVGEVGVDVLPGRPHWTCIYKPYWLEIASHLLPSPGLTGWGPSRAALSRALG